MICVQIRIHNRRCNAIHGRSDGKSTPASDEEQVRCADGRERIHDKQYQLQSEVALHADEICETRTSDEDRANPKENRVYVIKGTPEAEINGLGTVRECRSLQIAARRRVQQSSSHSARACNDDTTRNESGFTTVCLNATNERLTLLDFSCKW